MTIEVSVIVPCYNDGAGLRLCLDALSRQNVEQQFEVIVVDNGSNVIPSWVESDYRFARLVTEATKGSYAARNAGVEKARGRILAFTDADCRPDENWVRNGLERFADPECEAVGGKIELDRSASPSAAELYEHTFVFRQQRWVEHYGFAATANLFVRRETFDRIGWFNSKLRSAGDRDWGQRFTSAGGQMLYAENCVVHHPPRTRIPELVRKRRRLESGFRLVAGATRRNGADHAERPTGFRVLFLLLLRPSDWCLSRWEAVKVLTVALVLTAVGIGERLKLMLGSEAQR